MPAALSARHPALGSASPGAGAEAGMPRAPSAEQTAADGMSASPPAAAPPARAMKERAVPRALYFVCVQT